MRNDVITTCTRDCPNSCGLIVTVEDGRAVRIGGNPAHPFSRGKTCRKAPRYLDRVYSSERILYPLRRHNRKWIRISWDEALDEIAHRMNAIKQAYGSEAILYYQGFGERTALKLLNNRFFNLFGGVSTLTGTLCGGTGQASQDLDFGCRVSHDPLDHINSRTVILWGRNPVRTAIGLVPIIGEVKKRGGTVVVVDPIVTETARLADFVIQPAPGRDAYLALAAAKIVLSRGRQDDSFLQNHTEGLLEFKKIVDTFSLSHLAALCDVEMKKVEQLADLMVDGQPASIVLGWGIHRYVDAHLAIRAIDALSAISGNIGISGGGVSQGFEEYAPFDASLMGFHLCQPGQKLLMPIIGQEILDAQNPPIQMILVTAGNPVCMAPNSNKVAKAFANTDFVVLAGQFLDDTSDYANLFLPCTTFLEEDDIVASYGHNYVGPVNQAIVPLGEAKSNFEFFQALAKRFQFASQYDSSIEKWLSLLCRPLLEKGLSMEELRKGPVRVPDAPMVPYHDRIFPTYSGKFQFITELESFQEAADNDFPYRLLSISPMHHVGSELTLSEHELLPTIFMNDDEAKQLGFKAGQQVQVRSEHGSIQAVLQPDVKMRRDTVAILRGGWIKAGHGVNRLTVDLVSKVGSGTPYYETRVIVEPSPEPES